MTNPGVGEGAGGMIMHDKLPDVATQYLESPKLVETDAWNLKVTSPTTDERYIARHSTVQLGEKAPKLQADVVFAKFRRGDVKPGKPYHLGAKPDKDYFWNRTLVHYDNRGRVVATTEATGCDNQALIGGDVKKVETLVYAPDGKSREITTYTKDGSQWREEISSNQPYFVNDAGMPRNAKNDGGVYLNSAPVAQAV